MPALPLSSLHALLSQPPTSPTIPETLAKLYSLSTPPKPEIKPYPDAQYHNYPTLSLSLCFVPNPSPASPNSTWSLDAIDIQNAPPPNPANPRDTPSPYAPPPPLTLDFADDLVLPPRKPGEAELRLPRDTLTVTRDTTGREIVRCLGEPSRKGAGAWVGVWLEWSRVRLVDDGEVVEVGIMLELADPKGMEVPTEKQKREGMGGVWDRAAGWTWAGVKVFRPFIKPA